MSTMDQAKPNERATPAIGVAPPPSAAGVSREVVFDIDESVGLLRQGARGRRTSRSTSTGNAITALIGPSGCGKSTVLRCLNRMNDLVPSARVEGKLLYHGTDLYGTGVDPIEVRRRIGMVFQRPNPFPKSIYDNVAYGLRILGMKDNLDDRVEQALRGAALWDEVKNRLKRSALGLSGGQQQRLCIARAIAVEPDVILLDEPRLGARSDLDPGDRGPDARAEARLHARDRHPQHAAGSARRRDDRVLQPRGGGGRRAGTGSSSSTTRPRRSSRSRPTSAPRATSPAASDERSVPRGARRSSRRRSRRRAISSCARSARRSTPSPAATTSSPTR